jgi:hypothetical protein
MSDEKHTESADLDGVRWHLHPLQVACDQAVARAEGAEARVARLAAALRDAAEDCEYQSGLDYNPELAMRLRAAVADLGDVLTESERRGVEGERPAALQRGIDHLIAIIDRLAPRPS